ncbi:vWA domain-containing protein [Tsukamurella soli]|uniref:Anionic cell wall polymer biosynthesis enzyme, LytR-Cps2A-Psr (LCP) family n=1 Tax=Tsukamurella soli TaxID=644556 RepID=A0ABP8JV89_9ACTN
MDLRWWPVAIVGACLLVGALGGAMLGTIARPQRMLRPLANVHRLTGLSEYARLARRRAVALVALACLLTVAFGAAVVTAARPVGASSATRSFESEHPEDVMICVGQPVTDPTTSGLLTYFAETTKRSDTLRIGLTSPTLRVIPMTRDHMYAETQLTRFARVSPLQAALDAKRTLPTADSTALESGIADFSRPIDYTDYAPSVNDVLALCLTGFPSFESRGTHRRSLIYLGYSDLRSSTDPRPSLFDDTTLQNMATRAGVQVNVIARTDVVTTSARTTSALRALAAATGGRYRTYNPAGSAATTRAGVDSTLRTVLDGIRANRPQVVLPDGKTVTSRSWDSPAAPLYVCLVAVGLLSAALVVVRR